MTLKPNNATYLLHAASILKLVPQINNPDQKKWAVSADILKPGNSFPIGHFGGREDIDTHYYTVQGNQNLKVAIDFSVEFVVQDRDTFEINIPYRDTLTLEYVKNI